MTPYLFSELGEPLPVLPSWCPFGEDGAECGVSAHCRRSRSCGPGYGLVVAVCRTHGRYFTLYPPGWVPYGRVPLVRQASEVWGKTLFAAVVLASEGEMWPEVSVAAPGCGATQRRQIARGGDWLGLSGSRTQCEVAALALHVPLELALRLWQEFRSSQKRRDRGRAGAQMLRATDSEQLLWRLLALGADFGVCGRAYRCGHDGVLHALFPVRNGGH